jgi:hypothetical protein
LSVTTVTVTDDPVLFALTKTPSIAPSAAELTSPASAATGACAKAPLEARAANAKLMAMTNERKNMIFSRPETSFFLVTRICLAAGIQQLGRGVQDRLLMDLKRESVRNEQSFGPTT